MNLLEDEWIPVWYPSGGMERIPPSQLTEKKNGELPVDLAVENDELRWTIREFLIALYQTVVSPDQSQRSQWEQSPPSPGNLRKEFTDSEDAFGTDVFMQSDVSPSDPKPIRRLPLFGMAENSEKYNKEWFAEEKNLDEVCPACFCMFLFSRNMRKPSGNAWYPGSIRGNTSGVLSTLVYGETLWDKIWQNVLPERNFPSYRNGLGDDSLEPYPWMLEGEIDGRFRTKAPSEGHPYEVLWAKPQLIAGVFEEQESSCDGCGRPTDTVVREFAQDNGGIKYEGPWRHPFSPFHNQNEDGSFNYGNLNNYESGYRFWRGLLYEQKGSEGELASVIDHRLRNHREFRMTVLGQSMYSRNNVSFFVEETYPAYSEDVRSDFRYVVDSMVTTAESVQGRLKMAVYKCDEQILEEGQWKNRTGDRYPENAGLYSTLETRFWQETSDAFFRLVDDYADGDRPEPFDEWKQELLQTAEELYEEFTESLDADLAERTVARDDLNRSIHSMEVEVEK